MYQLRSDGRYHLVQRAELVDGSFAIRRVLTRPSGNVVLVSAIYNCGTGCGMSYLLGLECEEAALTLCFAIPTLGVLVADDDWRYYHGRPSFGRDGTLSIEGTYRRESTSGAADAPTRWQAQTTWWSCRVPFPSSSVAGSLREWLGRLQSHASAVGLNTFCQEFLSTFDVLACLR